MIIEEFEAKQKTKSEHFQTDSPNKFNEIEKVTKESNSQGKRSNLYEPKDE